jgi:hypothetical protein
VTALERAQARNISGEHVHVPLAVREQVRRAVVAHLQTIEEVAVREWVGDEHIDEAFAELAAIIRRVRP